MIQNEHTSKELANGRKEMRAALGYFAGLGLTGEPPAGAPKDPVRDFCRPENLDALLVRHRGGGWVAAVMFRAGKAGEPNAIRTAMNDPYPTYRDAMLAGREMIGTLLAFAQLDPCPDGKSSSRG